jgi:hypothetical protein
MPKPLSPDDPRAWPNEAGSKDPAEGSREHSPSPDERDSVTHDRQSPDVNKENGDNARTRSRTE